jgi:membrane protease YdiL (CAAX protease family)
MKLLRRIGTLFEVFGVLLAGPILTTVVTRVLGIEVKVPLLSLTASVSDPELVAGAKQMFVFFVLQYTGYFVVIVPLDWWRRRRGLAVYGVTRSNRSWRNLLSVGLGTISLVSLFALLPNLLLWADSLYELKLGTTAPWRQALIDTSWCRWEFWFFMAVCSFGVIPIVEELLYRGYCQRRLAEDWGDGAAIVGTTLLLLISHGQYLRPDAYNIAVMTKVALFGVIVGIAFAWTKSLIPAIVAHVILNISMTPLWEIIVMAGLAIGGMFIFRRGSTIFRNVFAGSSVQACVVLGIAGALLALGASRAHGMVVVAMAVIFLAVGVEFVTRAKKPNKAPEPTTMAVTSRAPSSTSRASHGRGSS